MLRKTWGDWLYWWSSDNQSDQNFAIPSLGYDSSREEHQLLIEKQIKKVEQAYSDLLWSIPRAVKTSVEDHANKDTAVMLGAGLCGYYAIDFFTSNIPLLGSTIKTAEYMVAIYCLYHFAQEMRAEQKTVFEQELASLSDIFDWCAKNGAEVSNDDTFLKMCQTLAPYCRTQKLMQWSPDEMSKKYKAILAMPPHNQVFQNVQPLRQSSLSIFGYSLPEQYSPISASTRETSLRIIADIKRWGYGSA